MKNLFFLITLFFSLMASAQTKNPANTAVAKPDSFQIKVDSLLSQIEYLMEVNNELLENIEIDSSLKDRYKLYQTDNTYNLLQLDTKTGKIEQIQWSLDRDKEHSVTINNEDFSMGYGSGVFELYPTKNIYQFILIDKTNGRKWHVQWGLKASERWIRRMY